ncbi:hypothetical protein ACH4JZ_20095 [Streptomyces sp. NPDC017615]|uniref:hypothetical protein n=1 Tax=Streptomyces sp. NPDC017615 TaxID=3365003 RepID=UPI003790C692
MEMLDVLARMVKTGRLGPVFVGADWHDVTAALGEPRLVLAGRRNRKWPRLFGYGDLELSVCRCRKVSLVCVQTWQQDAVELPPAVAGGTGTFPAGLRHADVVAALDRAGCPWEPHAPLTFGDQCTLVATPSGAHLTFWIPEGEKPVLQGVALLGDGHDCQAPRLRKDPEGRP